MPTNTNDASIPASGEPVAVRGADVDTFVEIVATLARDLPLPDQALLPLILATAATGDQPDVSPFLAGFPIPNPEDVIIAASGASTGAQAEAVIGPSAAAITGDRTTGQALGAAGSALARAVLNRWGEQLPVESAQGRGIARRGDAVSPASTGV
jgi:hypothetical protein